MRLVEVSDEGGEDLGEAWDAEKNTSRHDCGRDDEPECVDVGPGSRLIKEALLWIGKRSYVNYAMFKLVDIDIDAQQGSF